MAQRCIIGMMARYPSAVPFSGGVLALLTLSLLWREVFFFDSEDDDLPLRGLDLDGLVEKAQISVTVIQRQHYLP